MSRTRNLADLLDANGDVKSAALDNVPPSNDASALTTGTLDTARLPGTIDGRDVSADGTKLDGIESGATADQSAAEIKSAYESNANTNPFTDSLQTKLSGIEASADVTDATNVASAGALMTTGGTIDGALTITRPDNTTQLTLKSTDSDASEGPRLDLHRESASPADGDIMGTIRYIGENNVGENVIFGEIETKALDITDGTEDSELRFFVRRAGNFREAMMLGQTGVVFNESSDDMDFRIESNGNTNMLFVNGGTNRVGIGTNSPSTTLHVNGDITANNLAVANTPVVTAIKGSDQTLSRNTWTRITGFSSSEYDSDGAWNGYRFTVPSGKGGRYLCIANLRFTFASAGNDGEQVIGAFYINGAQKAHFTQLRMMSHRSIGLYAGTGSIIQNLSAGDYVEVWGYMQDDSASGSLKIDGHGSTGSRVGFMRID